jgi:hypothetical protein
MTPTFVDIHAAADFLGPGAVEVPLYQTEIIDVVRRRGIFGQRIKHVPATGHPSRYFEETSGAAPTAQPMRIERSVPLKAIVGKIDYGLFEEREVAYLQAKDMADMVDAVMRLHDVALWNGTDTSLSVPTTAQYFGATGQIAGGDSSRTITSSASIVDGLKSRVAEMVANSGVAVRPTAIYANPVLLDLIDREVKSEYNVTLKTAELCFGFTVKTLSTQAGELPLIPDWTLTYFGTPGSGGAVLPAYIVTEHLIEYHWLSDPNPRVFRLGVPGSMNCQYVVVKFGAIVVKGASFAHSQVLVDR